MKKTFAALVAAATLATVTVPAASAMESESNMLVGAIYNALSRIGADTSSINDLTIAQIAQIKGILDSDEMSEGDKKSRVEAIIAR